MSLVRVAVPVLHGRRRFHFDKGRRWSIIEHVLLDALTREGSSAAELAERANVPRRVAIEALIRLMRAGWVEMRGGKEGVTFRATANGVQAVALDELPSVPRRLSRVMNFVVDQISGTIYRSRELSYYHHHVVAEREKKETIVYIDRPSDVINTQVQPLVEALFLDDERFVSMDWNGERLSERWSLIAVRDGTPEGIPARAPEELTSVIRQAARAAKESTTSGQPIRQTVAVPRQHHAVSRPREHSVDISGRDVILGGEEHKDAFKRVILGARHRVLIHSTFVSVDRFMDALPDIEVAHGRGVAIDVLWGQNESLAGVRSSRDAVKNIQEVLNTRSLDRVRIHPFSTESHCKVIVADVGEGGEIAAWVGSCNWLSSGFQSFEASIRLRSEGIVADVIDQLAELSKGARGHWTELTNELGALAAGLRSRSKPSVGRARAEVVVGGRHAELVRRARDESQQQMFVVSHRFGAAGSPAILIPAIAAARGRGVDVSVYYGTASSSFGGTNVATATNLASEGGVVVRPIRKPRVHAKLLSWDDDSVVITSQNWLSSDPPENRPLQEVGVFVNAPGLARNVRSRFEAARTE